MLKSLAVATFAESVFQPAVDAWSNRTESKKNDRFLAATLLEAYGWINLGVRADAFDSGCAHVLVEPHLNPLREANDVAIRESLFNEGMTSENRRAFSSKKIFGAPFSQDYPNEFAELPEASNLFSTWCGEARSYMFSASDFVETLNFARLQDWDVALGLIKDDTFRSEADAHSPPSLTEQYFRSLQHLDRMAELLSVAGTSTSQWPARAVMRIELATIHVWRINFQNNVFRPRFDAVTAAVEQRLRAEAAREGIALTGSGFVRAVGELRTRFNAALKHLEMTASG